jgi:hypothetical protein
MLLHTIREYDVAVDPAVISYAKHEFLLISICLILVTVDREIV